MLSRRIPPLGEVNAWTAALEAARATGADLLDLSQANPMLVGLGGLSGYWGRPYEIAPRGLPEAREAVSGYYAGRGIAQGPDDIVITSGTSESYAHLFRMLADPGDTILAPRPSYPLFEPLAAAEGVALRSYALRWDGAWHVDLASVDEALSAGRARALILVQPHHPTGWCADAETLEALEARCESYGVSLVSDEVFGDFPWRQGRGLPSLLGGERRVPTFVLSGFSKVCGMPDLKVGWIALAGPSAARAQARAGLEWLADLFLSVMVAAQAATPFLFEMGPGYRERVLRRITENLGTLETFLSAHPDVDLRSEPAGWAALLRLPAREHAPDWPLALMARGVAVHPGHFYDLDDDAYVVVSMIVPTQTFTDALTRIGELLDRG